MQIKVAMFIIVIFGLLGCTPPRVVSPKASIPPSIFIEKFEILGVDIQGQPSDEELRSKPVIMSGEERIVLFPGQAREFIRKDIEDWTNSRFRTGANSQIVITIKIKKAYSDYERTRSGANWIPLVGIAAGLAEDTAMIPIKFLVLLHVDIEEKGKQLFSKDIEATDVFMEKGVSGPTRHAVIYNDQLEKIRKILFDRLDIQVLPALKEISAPGTS